MPVPDTKKLIENRVAAIKDYHEEVGIKRAQLDVSGGVDSAVMLGLLAQAVGPNNITAVYSNIDSSKNSQERAEEVASVFNVPLINIDCSDIFDTLVNRMHQGLASAGYNTSDIDTRIKADPTIMGSIRSCIRAPIGRGFGRMVGGGIRHGTGNECEGRWLRFYQKGGDGEVDTNPMAMLSKGEVYQLAIALGVPESILRAVPSPDLQAVGEEGHNDEDELEALTGVKWTYSKVRMEGDYISVGTIERMSRLLDENMSSMFSWKGDSVDQAIADGERSWNISVEKIFPGMSKEEFKTYFDSYKEIEARTRHKFNPNCPTLGKRSELVHLGLLTNTLPST